MLDAANDSLPSSIRVRAERAELRAAWASTKQSRETYLSLATEWRRLADECRALIEREEGLEAEKIAKQVARS